MAWPRVPLLDVCENRTSGITEFNGVKEYLSTGDLDFDKVETTEKITYDNRPSRANRELILDDVICARMQDTVKVLHINTEVLSNVIVSTGFIVLHPKENLLPKYLRYFFLSKSFNKEKNSLCNGATQRAINDSNLKKIKIPLPPLPDQIRIVEILEKADSVNRKRQEADEKGNGIIQTIFLGMFGDPISNQKKWPIKSIGESVEFVDYGLAEKLSAAITSKEGIPIVRISNVLLDGSIDLSNMRYIQVSKDIENKLTLKDCDLLFNWRNGSPEHVGKTAMWRTAEQKHIFVSFLLRIRFKEGVTNPWYLWELINYLRRKDYFKNISRMQINTKFNATELRAMKIPVPSYDLQQKFATLVQKVEKIKEKQQESKRSLDSLFNSLMNRVFKDNLHADN